MPSAAPVSHFPVLDRNAALAFLDFLDPDTDKFTFQTFTDSDEKKEDLRKKCSYGADNRSASESLPWDLG